MLRGAEKYMCKREREGESIRKSDRGNRRRTRRVRDREEDEGEQLF